MLFNDCFVEVIPSERGRVCSHGHRLHVLLERFGLHTNVLCALLEEILDSGAVVGLLVIGALRLVQFFALALVKSSMAW